MCNLKFIDFHSRDNAGCFIKPTNTDNYIEHKIYDEDCSLVAVYYSDNLDIIEENTNYTK